MTSDRKDSFKKSSLSPNIKPVWPRKFFEFISTPYSVREAIFLNSIGVEKFKVASADIDQYVLMLKENLKQGDSNG